MKKNFKYMHLINGHPAGFSKSDGQICYATPNFIIELCDNLQQIKYHQEISKKNRLHWFGKLETSINDYGYIKVTI